MSCYGWKNRIIRFTGLPNLTKSLWILSETIGVWEMTTVVETEEETKEYHLKRLYELSLKSLKKTPELEKLNEEQEEWVKKHDFWKLDLWGMEFNSGRKIQESV